MKRRFFLLSALAAGGGFAGWQHLDALAQQTSEEEIAALYAHDPDMRMLVEQARQQIGITLIYDGSYQGLEFPGGDITRQRGVCSDVVVRALRDAFDLDLQVIVNTDMRRNFSAYPRNWGLSRTDRNIDHRRVPNLETLFSRLGASRPVTSDASAFRPGDIVTWRLHQSNLPHTGLVSDKAGRDSFRIIHNIGLGTREDDMLFSHPITGHFRLTPEVRAQMRRLQNT